MHVGLAMAAAPPFDAMTRRVSRLARAGVASFWWPDHLVAFHSTELWAEGGLSAIQPDPNAYADPFLCMAAAAPAAEGALVGVAVTDAIRRSAATLAQTVMTLDHIAPGRVVLGLGSGEYANWAPYGLRVPPRRRCSNVPPPRSASCSTPLDPTPTAPCWGCARLLTRAGPSSGWPPTVPEAWPQPAASPTAGSRTGSSPAHGARPAMPWRPRRRDAGRDPDGLVYGLSAQVVVQDSHEAAHRLLEHPVLKAFALLLPPERYEAVGATHPLGTGGLHGMVATQMGAAQVEAARAVPTEVVHDLMLHGTAGDVAAQLAAYGDVEHLVLWDPVPLVDLAAAKVSAAAVLDLVTRLTHAEVH